MVAASGPEWGQASELGLVAAEALGWVAAAVAAAVEEAVRIVAHK